MFPRNKESDSLSNSSSNKQIKEKSLLGDEFQLFGRKRARNIEVVVSKDKKRKSDNNTTFGMANNKTDKAGLGMAKTLSDGKSIQIENLNIKKYAIGSLVFGYVLQIKDDHIIVSLPGGITGIVTYAEMSDVCYQLHSRIGNVSASRKAKRDEEKASLKELISVMSPIRCYVRGIDTESRRPTLQLSMRLSLIHRGMAMKHLMNGIPITASILSIEDDGYMMSTGIPDVTFFLKSKHVPQSLGKMVVGRTVDTVVDKVNESARTVMLRAQTKSTREAVIFGGKLSFNNLLPGQLLNIVVDKVVQVSIINYYYYHCYYSYYCVFILFCLMVIGPMLFIALEHDHLQLYFP